MKNQLTQLCILIISFPLVVWGCSDDSPIFVSKLPPKYMNGGSSSSDGTNTNDTSSNPSNSNPSQFNPQDSDQNDDIIDAGCIPSECRGTCCGDVCRDTMTNVKHCGECNKACSQNQSCVNGTCQADETGKCSSGEKFCNDTCINVVNNPENCGGCNVVCGEGFICNGTSCVVDCGERRNECEEGKCFDILSDPKHCGACGNKCNEGEHCNNSHCITECEIEGQIVCNYECVDTETNPAHCGTCYNACNEDEICSNGRCSKSCPDASDIICNRTCVNAQSDPDFCGDCQTKCTEFQRCSAGVCTNKCNSPSQIICNHECIEPSIDNSHCGSCEDSCEPNQICKSSACSSECATAGQIICNHACVDIMTDKTNCGLCGKVCDDKHICTDGSCVCPDNDSACDDPIPECTSPEIVCGHTCANISTSPKHCGSCGNDCGENFICKNKQCIDCSGKTVCDDGMCYDLQNDQENCGACGVSCPAHVTCTNGNCSACENNYVDCDGNAENGCEKASGECDCRDGETKSCYYGPSGTESVGACKAGTQTCQNGQWSDCVGMVLPKIDYQCRMIIIDPQANDLNCDGKVDGMEDYDNDGVTICGGDCCDVVGQCSVENPALITPGNYEIVGNKLDDNCNGQIDENPVTTCTASYTHGTDLSQQSARDAAGLQLAKAMDICDMANEKGYGIVSATVQTTLNDGGRNGNLGKAINVFPFLASKSKPTVPIISPKSGKSFAGISTGTFKSGQLSESDYFSGGGNIPSKYHSAHGNKLQTFSGCSSANNINDSIHLKLTLKAPKNATGFKFDFRFYSHEYPSYVCTQFNDFFIATLDSKASGIPSDGNIVFDKNHNPVSVNNAFFTSCEPISCGKYWLFFEKKCPANYKSCTNDKCMTEYGACPDGTSVLPAFAKDGGATAWLSTQAPVVGGETFTLNFYIWDTGDSNLDSAAIIDNFQWLATGGTVAVDTGFTDPRI